jgi:ribosomal protein S18 acetylase RimI-like enzyme
MLLKIRRFVLGKDEADWVKVYNAIYYLHPSQALIAVEDFRKGEKDPTFDTNGRFIAEVNDSPVGFVHASVDKFREDKKGFVWKFGVIPEFRGQGIEEKLAETAMVELKKRGMKAVQSLVEGGLGEDVRVWRKFDFKHVRRSSIMAERLNEIKSNVGENMEVVLEPLRKDANEDLELLNRLHNESFKEHFNYRPTPLESTVYQVREDFSWKTQGWFFALLEGKHVGFVGAGIGELDNRASMRAINVKRGWILPRGWILGIGVLKPHRRRGIGTRLILHGMNFLKAEGMTTAMLGVDDSNVTKAKQLCEKVGFREVWKQSFYEKSIA